MLIMIFVYEKLLKAKKKQSQRMVKSEMKEQAFVPFTAEMAETSVIL